MKKDLVKAQIELRQSPSSLFDIEAYRPVIEEISAEADLVAVYGARLKECRRLRGVSQKELSQLIGTTDVAIHKIEAGKCHKINVDYFLTFCQYFGATPEYFLGFEDVPFSRERGTQAGTEIPLVAYLENWKTRKEFSGVSGIKRKTVEDDLNDLQKPAQDLRDPMEFFAELPLKKASFVITRLWDRPQLLYKLYFFSLQPQAYRENLRSALALTFLIDCDCPSDGFFWAWRQTERLAWNEELRGICRSIAVDMQRGVKAPELFGNGSQSGDNAYTDDAKSTEARFFLQHNCETAFLNLAAVDPQLLDEFTKIAFLTEKEKDRLENYFENYKI